MKVALAGFCTENEFRSKTGSGSHCKVATRATNLDLRLASKLLQNREERSFPNGRKTMKKRTVLVASIVVLAFLALSLVGSTLGTQTDLIQETFAQGAKK